MQQKTLLNQSQRRITISTSTVLEILVLIAYTSSDGSDKPVQMQNFTRALATHTQKFGTYCKTLTAVKSDYSKTKTLKKTKN